MRRFALRYGWRAYALPVLTVITVVTLLPGHSHRAAAGQPPTRAVTVEGQPTDAKDFSAAAAPRAAPVVVSLGTDAATSCRGNHEPQLLLVSISRQHLWACAGQKQVNTTPVTTGETDNGDHTPLGTWRVQAKQRDRYLVGPGYRDYVQYWVPFNGDFGFHDASWQTMPFGSQGYKSQGSHGCVHLPTPTMAWLYKWVVVNQAVVTVEA